MAARKKKTDIWMPLTVGDYLRDTPHLTTEQHGAYLLLIMAAWTRGGALPDDDAQLAAIARLTPQVWRKHAPVLRPFFKAENGQLTHGKVVEELAHAQANSEARKVSGAKGAEARWGKGGKAIANGMAKASQNDDSSPSPRRKGGSNDPTLPSDGRPPAPDRRGRPSVHLIAVNWSGPAEIFDTVVEARGLDWAQQWLLPCGWQDIPEKALICTAEAEQELRRGITKLLGKSGVRIVRGEAPKVGVA